MRNTERNNYVLCTSRVILLVQQQRYNFFQWSYFIIRLQWPQLHWQTSNFLWRFTQKINWKIETINDVSNKKLRWYHASCYVWYACCRCDAHEVNIKLNLYYLCIMPLQRHIAHPHHYENIVTRIFIYVVCFLLSHVKNDNKCPM